MALLVCFREQPLLPSATKDGRQSRPLACKIFPRRRWKLRGMAGCCFVWRFDASRHHKNSNWRLFESVLVIIIRAAMLSIEAEPNPRRRQSTWRL